MVPKSVKVPNYHNTKINPNAHPYYIICEHGTAYLYFIPQAICLSPYVVQSSDSPPSSARWRVSCKSWLLFETLGQSVYSSLAALPSEVKWQTKASWHGPSRQTQFLLCIKKVKTTHECYEWTEGRRRRGRSSAKHQISLKPYSWSLHLRGDHISTRLSLSGGDRSCMKGREWERDFCSSNSSAGKKFTI